MQIRLHKIKIITLALCFVFLSGCVGQAKQESMNTPEAARMQPPGTPVPTSILIDQNEYHIDEEARTFMLKRTIIPKDGVPPMLLLVSGFIDENDYWLLADRLIIADALTGQTLQTYTLTFGRRKEPFSLTTKRGAESWSSDWIYDLIIEDLNFDGWLDFRIRADSGAQDDIYWYWLWNAEDQLFERSMELDALHLSSPEFFQDGQYFTEHYSDGARYYTECTYQYIDSVPTLVKQKEFIVENDIYDVWHVTIHEVVGGEMVITDEYEEPRQIYNQENQ